MSKPSKSMNELYPYNLLYAICEGTDAFNPIDPEHDLPADFNGSMAYMLATLAPEERTVLHLRYVHGMTVQEVAAQYTVSGEMIRRIEATALRKSRHPARFKYLRYGVQGIIQSKCEDAYCKGFQDGKGSVEAELVADKAEPQVPKENVLEYTIEELELSVRANNCLLRAGYETVADIMAANRDELMGIRYLGMKCYDEVCAKLESLGLDVRELRLGDNAEAMQ